MAARAKQAGFYLMVVFVGTASVEINLERVDMMYPRKISGGDIPEPWRI